MKKEIQLQSFVHGIVNGRNKKFRWKLPPKIIIIDGIAIQKISVDGTINWTGDIVTTLKIAPIIRIESIYA